MKHRLTEIIEKELGCSPNGFTEDELAEKIANYTTRSTDEVRRMVQTLDRGGHIYPTGTPPRFRVTRVGVRR